MNVSFNYQDALSSIMAEINNIPKEVELNSRSIMRETAKIAKKNTEMELSRLSLLDMDVGKKNYNGSKPYIHMKDDVKTEIRDNKEGLIYAVIKGGKFTGYKWHLVNNGTVHSRATHFADNALKQSESDFEAMIDNMIWRALQ